MPITMKQLRAAAFCGLALLSTTAANAAIKLDFEGLGGYDTITEFYNGGQSTRIDGATGRSGTNYGVSFSPTVLAMVDSDACSVDLPTRCNGNFANNPSGTTVMSPSTNIVVLGIAAGVTDQVSAWHITGLAASITVWSGLNGNDGYATLLGQIYRAAGPFDPNCVGNPNGAPFCHWSQLTLNFTGVAHSVQFGPLTSYDDVELGLPATPGAVPEPASWALLIAGFAITGTAMRRRKATLAVCNP